MRADTKTEAMKLETTITEAPPPEVVAPKVTPAPAYAPGEPLEYVTFLRDIEHEEHELTKTFNAADGYELRLVDNVVRVSRGGEETWVPVSGVWQMSPLVNVGSR